MKKSQAFTFAEVLLSLFVLAISMYIYSGLQFRSMRKVRTSTQEIERIFFIKKYLYHLYLNPPTKKKPFTTLLENPDVKITAHKQKINKKKSELKEFVQDLDIIWSQGTWSDGQDKRTIKMISLVPKLKAKKKK